MRKTPCLMLVLLLLLLPMTLPAFATDAAALPRTAPPVAAPSAALILTGKVEASESLTIPAPFGGIVDDFTVTSGLRVAAGEVLFTLRPVRVYAPADGTVGGIFAEPGDLAAYVQSQYGALCFIERTRGLIVTTTTTTGQGAGRDIDLTIGQRVYLTASGPGHAGEGRVIARAGDQFTVEILGGNTRERDTVQIYDDPGLASGARIGRGTVERKAPVAVTGDGSVLRVYVSEGDSVARGDLLFEMATGKPPLETVNKTVYSGKII